MSPSGWRVASTLVTLVAVVLLWGVWGSPDVEVFGTTIPAWLFGFGLYALGVGSCYAAVRSSATEG